jgi:CRISPR system Cascade subunit CasE
MLLTTIDHVGFIDRYEYHKFMCCAFGVNREYVYRVEPNRIFVASRKKPKILQIGKWHTKFVEYTEKTYSFVLNANPTWKQCKTKKRFPIVDYEQIVEWIERKSSQHGFDMIEWSVVKMDAERISIKNAVYNSVEFTGILSVSDQNKFADTLCSGIGSAKAFGFGALILGGL